MGINIAISNQKGGVGKSTTAYNLGAALVKKYDMSVLLIDLDPQANLSEYMGYEPNGNPTMTQLVMTASTGGILSSELVESAIRHCDRADLDYIPADINLANSETLMSTALSRETILRRILSTEATKEYNFIIIDCLPSLGTLLINALTAASYLLIPVQTQKFTLDGLQALDNLYQQIKAAINPNLSMLGVLPTMVDRTKISKNALEVLSEKYGDTLFQTSIKENGVLSPIIVQPDGDGFEILIGHNRWNASKLAGLPIVPAIVKTGLTEDEALAYTLESNIIQRGFTNLRISEQAAAIALRHKEMFSQGKRNDIIRELALLENPNADVSTLTPAKSRLDSGKSVGAEYGVSKGSVIRLIRIDKLTQELKVLVDSGDISIRAGVELSFLSEDTQTIIAESAEDSKLDMKTAKKLRETADSEGNISPDTVHAIIYGEDAEPKAKPKSVKISHDTYTKYFSNGEKPKEITETIEKALQFYFANFSEDE